MRRLPLSLVAGLCLLAFVLGRLSSSLAPSQALKCAVCAPCAPCVPHARRELLPPHDDPRRPNPQDWQAIAEEAGLLTSRPALQPAPSGVASYTIAPFQVGVRDWGS